MSKVVRTTLVDNPMTPARKRKLARIAAGPDTEIDVSEIPPIKEFLDECDPQPVLLPS